MDDDAKRAAQLSSSTTVLEHSQDRLTSSSAGSFSAHYDGDGVRDIVSSSSTGAVYFVDDVASPLIGKSDSGTSASILDAHAYADDWCETYNGAEGGMDLADPDNLEEVWPWEHDEIDARRHTGYTVLRIIK